MAALRGDGHLLVMPAVGDPLLMWDLLLHSTDRIIQCIMNGQLFADFKLGLFGSPTALFRLELSRCRAFCIITGKLTCSREICHSVLRLSSVHCLGAAAAAIRLGIDALYQHSTTH